MAYLSTAEFRARTLMPQQHIDVVEQQQAGFVQLQLDIESGAIDARLCKVYDAPFTAPYPLVVQVWLVKIVTLNVWMRRGFSVTDEDAATYVAEHARAVAEITEAANRKDGLFQLPLLPAGTPTALGRGGPRGYSEAGPYVWRREQYEQASNEDRWGKGTRR